MATIRDVFMKQKAKGRVVEKVISPPNKNRKSGMGKLRADVREALDRADLAFRLAGLSGLMASKTALELENLAMTGEINVEELAEAQERFTDLILQIADEDLSNREVSALINQSFPQKVQTALMASLAPEEPEELEEPEEK